MVFILILLNTSFEAAYKHVFSVVCVVILLSSMWSFNLMSEVKTSLRYFTFFCYRYIFLSYRLILWFFDSLLQSAIYDRLFVQIVSFLSFSCMVYLPR